MKVGRLLHFSLPLIAAVIALSAAARAQPARGKFTLPHEVHGRNASLPAGEYAYSIDLTPQPAAFMLLLSSFSPATSSQPDRLVTESVGGERGIAAMYMHELGVVFLYPVPQNRIPPASVGSGIRTALDGGLASPSVDRQAE